MKTDLKFYLRKFDSFLEEKICDNIVNRLENNLSWEKNFFYDYTENKKVHYSGEEELSVTTLEECEEKEYLMKRIWDCLYEYLSYLDFEWFARWHGYSEPRFNRYEKNERMYKHCDHIQSLFDGERKGIPTLTVLIGFNNNYTGGELVMWENDIIKLNKGDILIFPSNFLYPHRVDPVLSGVRYAAVSWVW